MGTPTVVELFMLSRERPKLKLIQKPGTHTLDIPHMPTETTDTDTLHTLMDTLDTHTQDTADTLDTTDTDTLTESKFSFYMGFRIWRNQKREKSTIKYFVKEQHQRLYRSTNISICKILK